MTGSAPTSPAGASEHVDGWIDGEAGLRLYWQAWLPAARPPRGVVVVAHGGAEHSGRYGRLVARLVPDGFAVYALDHRGHGRSEGPRGYFDRMVHVVADLDRLVVLAHGRHPDAPLFLLGHSLGGCIGLAYALAHQDRLDGIVLSAPVAVVTDAPTIKKLGARVLSAIAPRTPVYRVEAAGISRDPAEVAAYERDPLVHRGGLPARTITGTIAVVESFPAQLQEVTRPLLVVHGTADRIVPVAAAHLVHDRAGSADKTLLLYEGYYHELFNEPAGERERPLDDVAAWLAERAPDAPAAP